jgi:hypothetical protein
MPETIALTRTYTKKSIWLKAHKVSISVPEYWNCAPRKRPRTYEGLIKRVHRQAGIWCVQQTNTITGEVEILNVINNCLTDNGAIAALKNTINATSAGIGVANIMAIDASLGIATVGAISSGGTVTSIPVTALTGPTIPSGTTLIINPGQASKLLVSTTAAITGAGTCSVVSTAGPASAISAGSFGRYATATDVVGTALSSMPTTDASSLTAPVSYTAALPSGQWTFTATTGSGNRNVVVTNSAPYLFQTTANSNPSVATTGTYTAVWIVSVSPVTATSQTFVHAPLDTPLTIVSSSTIQITVTEKL